MTTIREASARRAELTRGRYTPIPLWSCSKVPTMEGWQQVNNVSSAMIRMWSITWPTACSTGILANDTPALDLDIYNEEAARAAEDLIRSRYEDQGFVLVRIGQAPKRLVPFRTEDPFPKITVNFVSEHGEKIEMLGAGQQFVCDGIHPITKQAYRWHGGEPWTIPHADLPYLHAEQAQELVADVAKLLTNEFSYQRASSKGLGTNGGSPQVERSTGEDRWHELISNIQHGHSLHESIRNLAGMLMASGMNSGAATHLLQTLVELSEVPHDQRWESRYRDVPRAIDTATKYRR